MERTIITWNLPNWITITLMATLGFCVVGVLATLFQMQFGSTSKNSLGNQPANLGSGGSSLAAATGGG